MAYQQHERRFRIAIAGFKLESVTFLPKLTSLQDFQGAECFGQAIIESQRAANTPIGGFIAVCEPENVELVPIVYTEVGAAGPASEDAFEHYLSIMVSGLASQALDGVLLDLHGAMTTPSRTDADADILTAVRRTVGPHVKVMVALDYHANLDATGIAQADAVFGYHFSPHTDQAETGARAALCLLRTLRGEIDPVWALAKPGLMVPSIFSATDLEPLAGVVRESIAMAQTSPSYLDVSIFAGFAYADVPNCGFSVVAVTDGDRARARDTAEQFSATIQRARPAFSHAEMLHTIDQGLAKAREAVKAGKRPVVLLEHADRMGDSTYLLRALLEQRVGRTAVPYLWDPRAAKQASAAGVGAWVRLSVGGHSSERAGGPVWLEGRVIWAGPKSYRVSGPYYTGRQANLGLVALVDTGDVLVSLTSRQFVAVDEDCFAQFGLSAMDFDLIVLRSKTHFWAAYRDLAAEVIMVDTPDWGPADLTTLDYRHIVRETTYPFCGADANDRSGSD